MGGPRGTALIGVVIPVRNAAAYLPAALDSVLSQTHAELDVVVVDDGSRDGSGDIAESYAARDPRVRVLRQDGLGVGAARNAGVRHVRGDWIAYADADDVVPPTAHERLLEAARSTGAEFATGDVVRLVGDTRRAMPWPRRLHRHRSTVTLEDRPELLSDVFAWNKLFRRDFWEGAGLSWPEGVRYEDQPAMTEAYVAARCVAVIPDVVYDWRQRGDGSSLTQQRAELADLTDRWTTKRMALATVDASGSRRMGRVLRRRVLTRDLGGYFVHIPGAPDPWWRLLVAGVRELWEDPHVLADAPLPPVHRLTGWLVAHDRRQEAEQVVRFRASHSGPLPSRTGSDGVPRIHVPGIDPGSVPGAALDARPPRGRRE